jgi:hypothetical protein
VKRVEKNEKRCAGRIRYEKVKGVIEKLKSEVKIQVNK